MLAIHNVQAKAKHKHKCFDSNVNSIAAYRVLHVTYGVNFYEFLSYDVASGSEITPCNKIDKLLVVYRSLGNVMTSITTLDIYDVHSNVVYIKTKL